MELAPPECTQSLAEMIAVVDEAMQLVIDACAEHEPHEGGAFCLVLPDHTSHEYFMFAFALVGKPAITEVADAGIGTVMNASQLLNSGRESSWLIRGVNDAVNHITGGAISLGWGALSFCGLGDDRADEAVALIAALKLGWITRLRASQLSNCSDNRIYMRAAASIPRTA